MLRHRPQAQPGTAAANLADSLRDFHRGAGRPEPATRAHVPPSAPSPPPQQTPSAAAETAGIPQWLLDGVSQEPLDPQALRLDAVQLEGLSCMYPEDRRVGCIQLFPRDLQSLQAGQYVNDSIMDFFIKQLQLRVSERGDQSCLFFNSFFHKKLAESDPCSLHSLETPEEIAQVCTLTCALT